MLKTTKSVTSSYTDLSDTTKQIQEIQEIQKEKELRESYLQNYHKRILLTKQYYQFPYQWRKYIWFLMILWIITASIMILIYGVQLDYNHYFENNYKLQSQSNQCHQNEEMYIPKIDEIYYNVTESLVISKNNDINNPTYLTSPWLYMILTQLLIYIFIYQPIIIAIYTMILHCKYKYKSSKINNNQNNRSDNGSNLISFFVSTN